MFRLVTIALTAAGLSLGAAAFESQKFYGQVKSSSGAAVELDIGGERLQFAVPAGTPVTLDRMPADLADLTADHVAWVEAQRQGEAWVATSVAAESQKRGHR